MSCRCEIVIDAVHDDTLLAGGGQVNGHRCAEHVDLLSDERVNVGVDRIHPRRNEHPGSLRSHLVDVVDDLRMPDIVSLFNGQSGLDLRKRIPISIVIVARVLVVELCHGRAFVGCSEVALVPSCHFVHAVRVQ